VYWDRGIKEKNVRKIIQAFVQAFKPEDEITLLMCCKYGTRPFGKEKENEERWTIKYELDQYLIEVNKTIDQCPHICLVDIPLHESLMPHLMARFDCLVGFSMGESTWLPGLQAMAMEIPIIQLNAETNGFMDYLGDVGFLCNNCEYEIADEELVDGTSEYYEGQKFAEGDINELIERMQRIYKERVTIRKNPKVQMGMNIAKNWTWEKTIEKVDKLLRR